MNQSTFYFAFVIISWLDDVLFYISCTLSLKLIGIKLWSCVCGVDLLTVMESN